MVGKKAALEAGVSGGRVSPRLGTTRLPRAYTPRVCSGSVWICRKSDIIRTYSAGAVARAARRCDPHRFRADQMCGFSRACQCLRTRTGAARHRRKTPNRRVLRRVFGREPLPNCPEILSLDRRCETVARDGTGKNCPKFGWGVKDFGSGRQQLIYAIATQTRTVSEGDLTRYTAVRGAETRPYAGVYGDRYHGRN
jgi:hypothetical protein